MGAEAKGPFMQLLQFHCMGYSFIRLMQGLFSCCFFFSFPLMTILHGNGRWRLGTACSLKPIMHPILSNLVQFQNPSSTEEIQVPGPWNCLSGTDIGRCRVTKRSPCESGRLSRAKNKLLYQRTTAIIHCLELTMQCVQTQLCCKLRRESHHLSLLTIRSWPQQTRRNHPAAIWASTPRREKRK